MAHAKDTKYQEFYELTVNSVKGDYPKGYIINRGLAKLGIDSEGVNPFNYDTLKDTWTSSTSIPTESALKTAAISQIETDKSMQYQGNRYVQYPDVRDQLDQLYHDMKDGKLGVGATTGSWYVGISSIKTANPKP
tara:strand:+ start:161 stop:565 length:405 start_codon:yes stop_codon:yes gene_type:complete